MNSNQEGIPYRCDEPSCEFQTGPLLWNGKPLGLMLSYIDGKPRYLCPNCQERKENASLTVDSLDGLMKGWLA